VRLRQPLQEGNICTITTCDFQIIRGEQVQHAHHLCVESMVRVHHLTTGAWNLTASKKYYFDEQFAYTLLKIVEGSNVVEFGAGDGKYKKYIEDAVPMYHAYDGAPQIEQRTGNHVRYMDLACPPKIERQYTFAICLETLEHIPKRFEKNAVDLLMSSTSHGLIISWARLGQGGDGHVNRKSIVDVLSLFNHVFTIDCALTLALREAAELSWFQRNTVVFRRKWSLLRPSKRLKVDNAKMRALRGRLQRSQ